MQFNIVAVTAPSRLSGLQSELHFATEGSAPAVLPLSGARNHHQIPSLRWWILKSAYVGVLVYLRGTRSEPPAVGI